MSNNQAPIDVFPLPEIPSELTEELQATIDEFKRLRAEHERLLAASERVEEGTGLLYDMAHLERDLNRLRMQIDKTIAQSLSTAPPPSRRKAIGK
ncbi:hypothetical protein JXD20_02070 [Candidatus Peregrinibacteria bacterium]|nr:hypothetical protein [Candidatus Peregrinibacteria bacterium]